MKLVYATDFDSKDIHNWSGLGVYYGRMLDKAGFDMSYLSDLNLPNPFFHFLKTKNGIGKAVKVLPRNQPQTKHE